MRLHAVGVERGLQTISCHRYRVKTHTSPQAPSRHKLRRHIVSRVKISVNCINDLRLLQSFNIHVTQIGLEGFILQFNFSCKQYQKFQVASLPKSSSIEYEANTLYYHIFKSSQPFSFPIYTSCNKIISACA
jgi:hypothetical protein